MFEGSYQGWSQELTKLAPWKINSRSGESFLDQNQHERHASGHEDNGVLNPPIDPAIAIRIMAREMSVGNEEEDNATRGTSRLQRNGRNGPNSIEVAFITSAAAIFSVLIALIVLICDMETEEPAIPKIRGLESQGLPTTRITKGMTEEQVLATLPKGRPFRRILVANKHEELKKLLRPARESFTPLYSGIYYALRWAFILLRSGFDYSNQLNNGNLFSRLVRGSARAFIIFSWEMVSHSARGFIVAGSGICYLLRKLLRHVIGSAPEPII
ncbi:hypothetical protein F511_43089 [Dorcoceras hygrometricum]|uniref:Uncharacterized protein n=1 Tax=Dorcoceras hygrometricum TaxID=472368 RepID=A0A2Z6ZYX3_9LAMI|nr:hypothetical protein F511_43089 [Dorcoceras hygrometricum]